MNKPLLKYLEEALKNLETLMISSKEEGAHVHNVSVKERLLVSKNTPLFQRTFELLSSVFPKQHGELEKKRQQIKQELIHSIELLKKHTRLIQKLQKGTPEEQVLAKRAENVIHRYHHFLKTSKHSPRSFKNRIVKFIYQQTGLHIVDDEIQKIWIDLPKEDTSVTLVSGDSHPIHQTALDLSQGKIIELTKNESDMFYMRGFSVAKDVLPGSLTKELISLMRENPIKVTAGSEEKNQSTIISMVQQLTPFPGELITVEGAFERNKESLVSSVPLPKSFRVSTVVSQTGFPHPSQLTGWSLTNALIPEEPIRSDLLSFSLPFFERKSIVAKGLLPQGPLNEKAKKILKMKKLAFDNSKEEFLSLHEHLSTAIIQAADHPELEEGRAKSLISRFYSHLKEHSSPFHYLSQTHHLINALFIEYPAQELHEKWMELHLDPSPKERFQTASTTLTNHLQKTADEISLQIEKKGAEGDTLCFVLLMGQTIGSSAKQVILEYQSEKIGFAPPLLRQFETKLQASAFRQVQLFYDELHLNNLSDISSRMKKELEEEIALFEADGVNLDDPFFQTSHELERYYFARFAQQK